MSFVGLFGESVSELDRAAVDDLAGHVDRRVDDAVDVAVLPGTSVFPSVTPIRFLVVPPAARTERKHRGHYEYSIEFLLFLEI